MNKAWQLWIGRWQSLPIWTRRTVAWGVGLLLIVAYPFVDKLLGMPTLNSVTDALVFVVLALGLNIVVGYAGLLDLGYAAFFAIGAYTIGIFTWPTHGLEWNFWVVIWICAAVASGFGLVLGAPTLRLRGDYLAIVTLAFGEIVPVTFRNMNDIHIPFLGLNHFNLTNGVQGLNPVGRPQLFGFQFGFDPVPWYFLILLVGGFAIFASRRLENSRLGRAWMAIREDQTAADCLGVDPIRTKLLAFAMGASFSGLAGAVYAAKLQAIFPELFKFQVSIMILCMVVLGGMGNIRGVVFGGLLIMFFDRVILAQSSIIAHNIGQVLNIPYLITLDLSLWRWFFFGAALIIIMVLRPEGLFPSRARQAELHAAELEVQASQEAKATPRSPSVEA